MKKQAKNAYRKLNWYKKAPSVREREACVQTTVTGNQTKIYVKLEGLDAVIISDVVSNLIETSDDEGVDDN